MEAAVVAVLDAEEASVLQECEHKVERGMQVFTEVGEALLMIRSRRLYRASHPTFEVYCRERWGMSKPNAYRLIEAATVIGNLKTSPIGDVLPTTESQARPLTQLKEPEMQQAAWKQAVQSAAGKQPTARQVEAAVQELRPPPAAPPPADSAAPLAGHQKALERCRRRIGAELFERCQQQQVPFYMIRVIHQLPPEDQDRLKAVADWRLRDTINRLTWSMQPEHRRQPELDPERMAGRQPWEKDDITFPRNPNGDNRLVMVPIQFSHRTLPENARFIKQFLTRKEKETFVNELLVEDVEPYPEYGYWERSQDA